MMKISVLSQEAINAARNQDWSLAIETNQAILEQDNGDVSAMNRLGLALMQTKKVDEAKKVFKKVIDIDKSNIIANKHLKKILNNQITTVQTFSDNYFIEEPGRTKIIELHRLASKHTLAKLSVGQACKLVIKSHYICVETETSTHIGSLPEDISFRLSKLITNGNEYTCVVHSCTDKTCKVLIKEVHTSEKNAHLQSFPVNKQALSSMNQGMEEFVLEDEIPIQTIDGEGEAPSIESALEKIDDYS